MERRTPFWIHHFPPIGKGISFSITPVAPEAPAAPGVTEKSLS
jgi:hypothetical protein